jgi:hypothetical protein
VTPDDARALALGLAGAAEQPHHGFPSFRVAGRIFATLPDDEHLHVMLKENDIRAAAAEWPAWCEQKWWGKRLAAARITLRDADPAALAELVEDAWRWKAAG